MVWWGGTFEFYAQFFMAVHQRSIGQMFLEVILLSISILSLYLTTLFQLGRRVNAGSFNPVNLFTYSAILPLCSCYIIVALEFSTHCVLSDFGSLIHHVLCLATLHISTCPLPKPSSKSGGMMRTFKMSYCCHPKGKPPRTDGSPWINAPTLTFLWRDPVQV